MTGVPDHSHAYRIHFDRANQLLEEEKPGQAVAEFQAALRLKPGFVPAHIGLARTYYFQGRLAEADAELKRVAELNPAAAEPHMGLGLVAAAQKHNIDVSVCGEMSGDPIYTMLLLGMGLRQLSVTPQNIPEIKKIVRTVTIEEATVVSRQALRLDTARDVNHYLREQTRRILPEVVN